MFLTPHDAARAALTLTLGLAAAACEDDAGKAGADAVDTTQAETDTGTGTETGTETTVEPEDPTVAFQSEFDAAPVARKCKDEDDGTNCLEPMPNAVRIDDERRLGWTHMTYDKDKELLELDLAAGTTLDPRIVQGGFLYRGRKDRDELLHRVVEIRQDGQHVAIKLQSAKAKEVFRKARIRVRIPIEDPTPAATEGMASAPLTLGVKNCTGNVFDKVIAVPAPKPSAGTIKLDFDVCNFTLTAYVDAVLQWDSGIANLDKLEVVVGGGLEAHLHAKLAVNLTGAYGASKTIWTGPKVAFPVGGLPITVTPSVDAGYSIDAAAVVTVEAGFDYSASIEEGFGWSDDLGWYTVDARTTTWSAFGPNVYFDGSLLATAYLKPRVDVKAFDFVGGYAALKLFAEADMTSTAKKVNGAYQGDLCTDLRVGVTPSVGASASIIGISLFDEEVNLVTLRKTLVDNACTAWSGPVPTDCDLASVCCTDGECPPLASDPDGTDTCEKGQATTDGQFEYSCVHHFSDDFCSPASSDPCNDGDALTTDTCVDLHCENTVMNALLNAPAVGPAVQACSKLAPPGCCFIDSDCRDGNATTVDKCSKDAGEGPSDTGTCTHVDLGIGLQVPPAD